jgi:hypothetical protein
LPDVQTFPSLIFVGNARSLTLYWSPLWYAPELPANIRLGRMQMAVTNTLTYYEAATITAVKCFMR